MESLGPWKLKRAGLRTSFTKTANVLKAELVNVEFPVDLVCDEFTKLQRMGCKMESPTERRVVSNLHTTIVRQVCTGEVALMTLWVRIAGTKRHKNVRVLLDCGSQRSYISTSLVAELGLPIVSKHSSFAEGTEEDMHRLRNFSLTPKGVINWGDSFRSHSLTSVPGLEPLPSSSSSQWDVASTKSYPMTASNSHWNCGRAPQRYRVAILGSDEVGKTSLIRQFQTSEYICAFDTSYDIYKEYAITVILNKEESELEFIEFRLPDEEGEEKEEEGWNPPFADAHVVVYSVTSKRSFQRALDVMTRVQRLFRRSAVLLVGNKSDLVRVRAVTTDGEFPYLNCI
ncbi:uncharacterized protein TNCT_126871 [Trichonephila clavata]|uniref:Uncharacterized protein n=1 Tax=Trichonephila clavata TaxID=2740835 RepID=A0A8X6LKE1_TRICU|nr:uncharacterized protein TNCT_126871 [Trichonephila clavata]